MLVENELKKLLSFVSSYFKGKNHFEEDGAPNYLIFQHMNKYLKKIGNTESISSWESKGLSNETIKPPDNILDKRMYVKFNGSCLKQDKITFNHGKILNIYVVNEITNNNPVSSYPTIENCLFGTIKVIKVSRSDEYKYNGYGIRFNRKENFSHPSGEFGRNAVIIGVDMSLSVHANNKKQIFWLLAKVLYK